LRVSPDTLTSGAPFACGAGVFHDVPLGDAEHQAAAFAQGELGDLQILFLEGLARVHHQHDDVGEADRVRGLGGRHPLELFLHLGALAEAGGVDQADLAILPAPRHLHAVARDAGFRPGDEAVVLQQRVDQRRLARVRAADKGEAHRTIRLGRGFGVGIERLVFVVFLTLQARGDVGARFIGHQAIIEIAHPLAMFGGERNGFAEAHTPGIGDAALALPAFALVGAQNDRLAGFAEQLGEALVQRRHAFAGVEQEDTNIGLADGDLGLPAHARFQRTVGDIVEAGGIDQLEFEIAQAAGRFLAVAGDAGLIVDDRDLPSSEPVEQRRLAHIGASHDGCRQRHLSATPIVA
jgi:hypothetical protein